MKKEMSREEMIKYLREHFRYDTANSWNRATSYAHNVKLHKFVPDKLKNKAYEILEQGQVYDNINDIMREFNERHGYSFQAWFNGRSSGYIVLGQGGREGATYKTRCDSCGRLTWYETEQPCHVKGCEGTLKKLNNTTYNIYTKPGLGLDMDDEFDEWNDMDLKSRVALVKDFDNMVERCKKEFIYFCKHFTVEEETVQVPKKVKVLVEN